MPTDTEVLVLALLLRAHHDTDKVAAWAREVIEDAPAVAFFDGGAEWKVSAWTSTKRHIPSHFMQFTKDDVKDDLKTIVSRAVAFFGERGRREHMGFDDVNGYLRALLCDKDDSKVLLGVGGGATRKKGAPLRRTYIMPRVARLLVEVSAELKSALDLGFDNAPNDLTIPGKVVRSPLRKAELKRALDEMEKENTNLDDAFHAEVRTARHAGLARWCVRGAPHAVTHVRARARARAPKTRQAARALCGLSPPPFLPPSPRALAYWRLSTSARPRPSRRAVPRRCGARTKPCGKWASSAIT